MTRSSEHDLMRLLHGELPADEARALRARIFAEPELTRAYRRLELTWQGLSLPPPAPAPPGFAGRVMAHVRRRSAAAPLTWSAAPRWARAAAAAALVAGAALGVGVGRSWPAVAPAAATAEPGAEGSSQTFLSAAGDASLADSYWSLVEDVTAGGGAEAQP
jgi:anti-sigma factor RsiW